MTLAGPTKPPGGSPLKRLLFATLGLLFVGLGFLGAFLPGLPATPFFLLAAYFFARSSQRLYRWLLASPVAGPLIRDWERPGGGVRLEVKIGSLILMPCVIACSIYFGGLNVWLSFMLIGLGCIGATVVILLPRARPIHQPSSPTTTPQPPKPPA